MNKQQTGTNPSPFPKTSGTADLNSSRGSFSQLGSVGNNQLHGEQAQLMSQNLHPVETCDVPTGQIVPSTERRVLRDKISMPVWLFVCNRVQIMFSTRRLAVRIFILSGVTRSRELEWEWLLSNRYSQISPKRSFPGQWRIQDFSSTVAILNET